MPNRELREGFLSSEALATLTAEEERLYTRLLLCADDFGRFDAKPTLVKSRAFPLADEMAGITVKSVTAWIQALFHKRLIRLYEVEGKSYMQIEKWRQRMRAQHSKYPPPPDVDGSDGGQMTGNCQADGGHPLSSAHDIRVSSIDISNDEDRGTSKRAPKPAKTSLPEGFAISDAVRAWFGRQEFSRESLQDHFDSFVLKARAKGYAYIDWDSAFMEAVRADWAKLRGGAQARASPVRLSAAAQAAARATAPRVIRDELETVDGTARLVSIG